MKWKAPSDRVQFMISAPVTIPLTLIAIPFVLPIVAVCWIESKLQKRFGSKKSWAPWYAWRPVKAETEEFGDDRWVWLETIDRRRFYDRTLYRLPQGDS